MKKGADSLPTQIAEYDIDFTAAKDTAYGRQLFYKKPTVYAVGFYILFIMPLVYIFFCNQMEKIGIIYTHIQRLFN